MIRSGAYCAFALQYSSALDSRRVAGLDPVLHGAEHCSSRGRRLQSKEFRDALEALILECRTKHYALARYSLHGLFAQIPT